MERHRIKNPASNEAIQKAAGILDMVTDPFEKLTWGRWRGKKIGYAAAKDPEYIVKMYESGELEKRGMMKEGCRSYEINARIAEQHGWTDIHGCPPRGTYCRGVNPETGFVAKLPDFLNQNKTK